MYTSYIGSKFLKLFNKKEETEFSPESFFDEIVFPQFFNNDRHFLNVANSSFFQSVSKKLLEDGKSIHQIKQERFHKNVKEDGASLTTMVGYAAQDIMAGTSGQLSNLPLTVTENEMYSSWIGSGFCIAMGAGYSILIDNDKLLLSIFLGWKYYRKVLDQTPNLKGNQIDVWNSHWISHVFSNQFDPKNPLDGFQTPEISFNKESGKMAMTSLSWSSVIFTLTKQFSSKTLTVNVFKFGKMNTTLGFINLVLPQIKKFYELRDKIFMSEDSTILKEKEIEELSTFYNFKEACKSGTIGLKAIEPAKLRQFMPKGSVQYAQGKEFKFNNEESYKQYQLYKIWIIAMLNKTELLETATDIAEILVEIESKQEGLSRGTKKTSQESKEFLEIKTLKAFIDGLTMLINKSEKKTEIKNCLDEILKMPVDSFPLFMALIRFEYSYKTK
ncbi:hypothetical protein [Labilibaculum euxinus]